MFAHTVNALNATELYISKRLRWSILCYVYFAMIRKVIDMLHCLKHLFLLRSWVLFALLICLVNLFITEDTEETSSDFCQISKIPSNEALDYNSKIINRTRSPARSTTIKRKGLNDYFFQSGIIHLFP